MRVDVALLRHPDPAFFVTSIVLIVWHVLMSSIFVTSICYCLPKNNQRNSQRNNQGKKIARQIGAPPSLANSLAIFWLILHQERRP